jgi:hypothetical protein
VDTPWQGFLYTATISLPNHDAAATTGPLLVAPLSLTLNPEGKHKNSDCNIKKIHFERKKELDIFFQDFKLIFCVCGNTFL